MSILRCGSARGPLIFLGLACYLAPGVRGDVTVRYQSSMKLPDGLPSFMEPALESAKNKAAPTVVSIKGSQASSSSGDMISILDVAKQELTLIDTAHKTFATVPMAEFANQIAATVAPAQAKALDQAMSSISTNVESKMTGGIETILGVQAEERELIVSMDAPAVPNMPQAAPTAKIVMRIWTAKPEEAWRVPAIRELNGLGLWQEFFLKSGNAFEKSSPGMNRLIAPFLHELFKNNSAILRMHTDLYLPSLAAMASQLPKQPGQPAIALDPNVPILQINMEIADLSTDPVDPSLFEIPKDFTAAPLSELIHSRAAAKQTPTP